MRITRNMLESYVSEINKAYNMNLSVEFFNGCTHLYNSGYLIEAGTTPECYKALSIFMHGFHTGMLAIVNREVKNK